MIPTVYLDCCALQRPFDDPIQMRIAVESEAMLQLIDRIEAGHLKLITSRVLAEEINKIPVGSRKTYCERVLALSAQTLTVASSTASLAKEYVSQGIHSIDALHLACAVEAKTDYFCTCDDRFLRNARPLQTGLTQVCGVLDLTRTLKI